MTYEKPPQVRYDLNADLKEVKRDKTKLRFKYALFLETFPAIQRAELEGDAEVESPVFGSVTDLGNLDQGLFTELVIEIYRKNYDTLYLILDCLGLDIPSPWIIRDVHLIGSKADRLI
ncbi:MAG: hypothetical protein HYY67_03780 [Thaumarchaeota archaeon]|nr:hypothetical protein [Nitrososphaerota archaeon]